MQCFDNADYLLTKLKFEFSAVNYEVDLAIFDKMPAHSKRKLLFAFTLQEGYNNYAHIDIRKNEIETEDDFFPLFSEAAHYEFLDVILESMEKDN